MENIWEDIVRWFAAAVGIIAGWYGGWTAGSKVLVILMVVDYITGCACALTGHSTKTESGHFWSQVAVAGILKKAFTMCVILMAALLDQVITGGQDAPGGMTMFRSAAEFFYIATEGMSIVENVGLMGVPVPKGLRDALEVLRDRSEDASVVGPEGPTADGSIQGIETPRRREKNDKVTLPDGQSYPSPEGWDGTARIKDSRRATEEQK